MYSLLRPPVIDRQVVKLEMISSFERPEFTHFWVFFLGVALSLSLYIYDSKLKMQGIQDWESNKTDWDLSRETLVCQCRSFPFSMLFCYCSVSFPIKQSRGSGLDSTKSRLSQTGLVHIGSLILGLWFFAHSDSLPQRQILNFQWE